MSSNLHEVARTSACVEAGSIAEAVSIAAAAHRRDDTDARIAERKAALEALPRIAVLARARSAGLAFGDEYGSLIDSLARHEVAAETLSSQAKADEDLLVRFEAWRSDVDSDRSLDTLTLAIGFFGGAGLGYEHVTDLALDACERSARIRQDELRALMNRSVL